MSIIPIIAIGFLVCSFIAFVIYVETAPQNVPCGYFPKVNKWCQKCGSQYGKFSRITGYDQSTGNPIKIHVEKCPRKETEVPFEVTWDCTDIDYVY